MANTLSFGSTTNIILVGTSTCPNDSKNLPNIDHVKRNISQLSKAFSDDSIIDIGLENNVTKILDFEESSAVIDKIAGIAKNTNDTLLIYYAGHGLYGDASEPLYLAVKNTTSDGKIFNAIKISDLKSAIASSPATKRI